MVGLMSIFIVVVFVFMAVGMLAHMALFGSLFWVITKKVADAAEQQRPKPCGFCGGTLLPEATVCEACWAPRDPKHVAARSASSQTRL